MIGNVTEAQIEQSLKMVNAQREETPDWRLDYVSDSLRRSLYWVAEWKKNKERLESSYDAD